MADFNADIKLRVAVENLEASVRKVENAFKKVNDYRVRVKVDGENELKSLGNSFKRLGAIIKNAGIVGAVGAISASLSQLNSLPMIGGGLTKMGALGGVVDKLGEFSVAAAQAAASAPGLAAGIAASTAAFIAFAPQIARATKDTLKIAKVAAEAQVPLRNVLNLLGAASSSGNLGGFGDAAAGVEEFRRRITELNESVSNLRKRSDALKNTLNQFNSGSATAEKIATKLVAVNARLNDELREQADLLRRVRGINVTELEASKGRNSKATRERADEFRAKQASEALRVQQSLQQLEQRSVSSLTKVLDIEVRRVDLIQKRVNAEQLAANTAKASDSSKIKALERQLAIEEQISRVRSARVAREANDRAKRLIGNPNQYGQGAVGPQSGRFDAMQAAARLAQQRLSIGKERQKVAAGTRFEFLKQVAVLKQVAAIGKQINEGTEKELRNQRRINRELKVKKGRAAQDRAAQLKESLALGVGFPLLFGGGAGSILGSAAGSFMGKGFGGQIIGGAIGQVIDDFVKSTSELGAALNPATADTDKLVEALGATNTPFAELIQNLNKSGQESRALALATQKMAGLIGRDGVDALRQFGEDSTKLGNEFAQAMTLMKTAVAQVMNSVGAFKALADQLGRANLFRQGRNSTDPQQQARIAEFDKLGYGGIEGGSGLDALKRRQELFEEIVQAQTKINMLEEQGIDLITGTNQKAAEKLANSEMELRVLDAKYALEQAGSDLTSDTVYELSKKVIQQEYFKELQDAINNGLVTEGLLQAGNIAELKMKIKLAALANQRTAALDRANKTASGGGSAPKSKALQLQQQLIKEELKRAEIGVRQTKIDQGEEAALKAKQSLLVERLAKETEVLELQRQQALENNKVAGDAALINQVYDSRLQTTTDQLRLELALNEQRQKALIRERELAVLADQRSKAAALASRDTNIGQLNLDLANPFGGFDYEQRSLELQQAAERTAVLRAEQEKLFDLERTQADQIIGTDQYKILGAQIDRQREYMSDLDGRIAQENELEMAVLKQNQTLQALQPITDGLAAGITDFFTSVIDGSKSAEEAFVDMLKGMAAALIQQGAQMIAQYMAIALAKALAGMGSSTFGAQGTQIQNDFGNFFNGAVSARADGGPVNQNSPYIVGEEGPELFIPGKSGTIVSNDAFSDAAAAMTGASQAFADSGDAMAMATATRSANSASAAEASALQTAEEYFASGKSTVSFDTYRVGEMDVVTREDAMKIGMESAKQAEANVYRGMRNMPAIRARTGAK